MNINVYFQRYDEWFTDHYTEMAGYKVDQLGNLYIYRKNEEIDATYANGVWKLVYRADEEPSQEVGV